MAELIGERESSTQLGLNIIIVSSDHVTFHVRQPQFDMTAPFNITAIAAVAEQLADELWQTDSYREDSWNHPMLGPYVRVYALLRHRPEAALGDDSSSEHLAKCRVYAYVFLSALYDRLTGAEPQKYNDGFIDLMTEYDRMIDVDFLAIHDSAIEDAVVHPIDGVSKHRLKRPGTVRRIR